MFKYLGDCIRAARIDCGLTQQELADQTGRGLRHIQNIEKGKINPSYEVLSALIKRLGISADALFNPAVSIEDVEIQHLIGKIMACADDEHKSSCALWIAWQSNSFSVRNNQLNQ